MTEGSKKTTLGHGQRRALGQRRVFQAGRLMAGMRTTKRWRGGATWPGRLAALSVLFVLGCPDPSAECRSNQDCRDQEVCVEEACRRVCNSSGDCTSHERCLNGVCLPGEPGTADGGTADTGAADVRTVDAGSTDAGLTDAGVPDVGLPETGLAEAGLPDTGSPDTRLPDAAAPDSAWPRDGFPDPWWDLAWQHRARLRFHHAYSDEAQADFVLPVVLTPDNFNYDVARVDGADLVFVDPAGGELLHEVEQWDTGGRSTLWVLVPHLIAGSDGGDIYLYYGHPSPRGSATSSIYPPEHELVLLMSSSLGPGQLRDSSSHAREVVVAGNPASNPRGVVGYSLSLGAADELEVPSLSNASFPQTTGTLSVVLKLEDWDASATNVLDDFSATRDNFNLMAGDNFLRVVAYHQASGSSTSAAANRQTGTGWRTAVLVWDLDRASNQMQFYVGPDRRVTKDLPADWAPAQQQLVIGEHPFAGEIEDLRIQSVARSRAWVDAHLNAQNDLMVIHEQAPVEADPEVFDDASWAGSPVALYEFNESDGDAVLDSSGIAPPLDLVILDSGAVERLPGALRVERATVIESLVTADKIVDACQASGEISVEAWIQPDHLLFNGPARVISLARDTMNADFTLGQALEPWSRGSARYVFRLRTDQTTSVGEMDLGSYNVLGTTPLEPGFSPRHGRTQVVFTRAGDQLCVYVDGTLAPGGCLSWSGVFDPWTLEKLTLANEWDISRDRYARPWLGTYYRVAIYCQALSAAQVQQNYDAGSSGS